MPPKPKFTRDQMITAAMNLIEEKGYESLTARELGKYLGSSSCPIFTLFKDMDELKTEVKNRAVEIFNEYMAVAEEFYPAYKKRGMQWVKFASEQPRLFRLLFMQETSGQADFDAAQKIIPFGKQNDIDIIMRDYNASREQAERLFRQMWIYSYVEVAFFKQYHLRPERSKQHEQDQQPGQKNSHGSDTGQTLPGEHLIKRFCLLYDKTYS